MEDWSLALWRLAADISVENAAILIAGGNPSELEYDDGVLRIKKTNAHPNFDTVFCALKAAILTGKLRAQLSYYTTEAHIDRNEPKKSNFILLAGSELQGVLPLAKVVFADGPMTVTVVEDPNLAEALIDVDDLKAWLVSRGHKTGFFFTTTEPAPDDFMDNAHEHFSAELALAVSAWRALSSVHKFPLREKAAIKDWIVNHPEAWLGLEPITGLAIERVITITNWNRKGGSPKIGG